MNPSDGMVQLRGKNWHYECFSVSLCADEVNFERNFSFLVDFTPSGSPTTYHPTPGHEDNYRLHGIRVNTSTSTETWPSGRCDKVTVEVWEKRYKKMHQRTNGTLKVSYRWENELAKNQVGNFSIFFPPAPVPSRESSPVPPSSHPTTAPAPLDSTFDGQAQQNETFYETAFVVTLCVLCVVSLLAFIALVTIIVLCKTRQSSKSEDLETGHQSPTGQQPPEEQSNETAVSLNNSVAGVPSASAEHDEAHIH